ncbi:hypothetical protein RDWZM_004297 [Blomia tropicalis]|uniref:Endoplasmic reticulum transmembrane protein n=1 Tax=Blomia tropicalis TaxID=40697 RepID=A0A9Q0MJR5_BLOTA|nr:hypothetical protein RDWZM_004297 [Blomia tropicalis]
MSVIWSLLAGFLYLELVIIAILLLPILKPKMWRSFFRSRFMGAIANQSNIILYIFIAILAIFFCDSIREFNKYSHRTNNPENVFTDSNKFREDQNKLFRAQRNFYITGFALFSLFIIKRLTSLISQLAVMKCEVEATVRQAQNISKQHMKSLEVADQGGDTPAPSAPVEEESEERKSKLTLENERLKKDLSALKKQTESTNREYDRLTEEFAKLQNKYDQLASKEELGRDR